MIYFVILAPVLCGFCSLAVDFGYVEFDKFQLQQIADATAHDALVNYQIYGSTSSAQSNTSTTKNSILTLNGVTPTVSFTWGYWNMATSTFSTTQSGIATIAVRVTASCKAANSNPIALMFARAIGQSALDMSASSTATDIGTSDSETIQATQNPYLSGMPSGTTTVWGDTVGPNSPVQASIPVVPGSWISFTVSGTTSVIYPSMPYYNAAGSTGTYGTATQHGQNWDGSILSASTDNGIANAIMPESSFMGMFLDGNRPDSTAAPGTTVDWTQSSNKNQNIYSNLTLKSPFYIGTGLNGATVKKFQVPANATRLFISIWDGVEYNNNSGSLSAGVNVAHQIMIVQ